MPIQLKRVQENPSTKDGARILVDRLWPRGISKEAAKLDEWLKEAAPSDDLRKWFHANPDQWAEFRKRYLAELKDHKDELRPLAQKAKKETITLLYGSKDSEHNNAVVLEQYLKMLK